MKAHELLSDKSKWCQGAPYKDAVGISCGPDKAAAYCAYGAIENVTRGSGEYLESTRRANAVSERLFGKALSLVNDHLGYDAVMQVLREADV
jgi:hypothetical protein